MILLLISLCSVATFLSNISGGNTKKKRKTSTSTASKIFSAIPFASVEEDDENDEDELVGRGSELEIPESLVNGMGTMFYLLKDTLVHISGSIETDASLTIEMIEQ